MQSTIYAKKGKLNLKDFITHLNVLNNNTLGILQYKMSNY